MSVPPREAARRRPSGRPDTGGREPPSRLEGALGRLYGLGLRLLPPRFRRVHGREMRTLALTRLRERRREGVGAALRHALAEGVDLVRVTLRLRTRALGLWVAAAGRAPAEGGGSRGARLAAATVLAAALVALAVDVRIEVPRLLPGAVSGAAGAGADSLDFRARDPAGEFTLSIRRGRVVAATVNGNPIPDRRVVQVGDSIRLLAPEGSAVVAVHFDPGAGRIRWAARSGEGTECAGGGVPAASRPRSERGRS